MKIGIYPLSSSLHEKSQLQEKGKEFLEEIFDNLHLSYHLISLEEIKKYDFVLIFVQSGGVEGKFLQEISFFQPPFLLLTYGHNNSLAASMEILSYLKDHDLQGEILHGSLSYIISKIKDRMMMQEAYLKIKGSRLGVIGKPSDWLIASDVSDEEVAKIFEIQLCHYSIDELCEIYENITDVKETSFSYSNQKSLKKAQKMAEALKTMICKHNLNGLTLRCFDLLGKVKTTGCLGLSLLNDQGIIGTCEGDVPAMLSMHILNALLHTPSFQANPSCIELEKKEMIFAHCTLPLSMTQSFTLDTHFESGIGVAIQGEMALGMITIFKLSRDLKHYYVETAEIVENLHRSDLCRSQIRVRFLNDMSYFLTRPYGNHHIILYGNHKKKIQQFMEYFYGATNSCANSN